MTWTDIPQRRFQRLSNDLQKHTQMMEHFQTLEETRLAMLPSTPQMLEWQDEDEDDY